jgi:asparagine synthase (glutamine-hydrolysing)
MCGILVYIGQQELGANHPSLNIVSHRGPDGHGVKTFRLNDGFISLGHRRLSIIDLSDNASQPMCFQDSGLWITYNGEIYNYVELRNELQKDGYIFNTNSDTEVLLALYHKWGDNCLKKINGMFAFSIWDNTKKKLFVARDRFGIKPLYYWSSSKGFIIASEIKQLTTFSEFEASINYETAFQFLEYGDFSYNEQTLWKNVLELEPANMFTLDLNKWEPGCSILPQKWYDYKTHIPSVFIDETEAINKFRYLLEDSIKLRLRADVQVGAMLSGGVDSSSITCLVDKNFKQNYPLRTISACYEESPFSEEEFIDIVLNHVSVESHKILLRSSDLSSSMDNVIWYNDLPCLGGSIFAHYLLYQKVHSTQTKVVMEGQGADEILSGYGSFLLSFLSESILTGHIITAFKEYRSIRDNYSSSLFEDSKSLLKYMFPNLTRMYKKYYLDLSYDNSYIDFQKMNTVEKKQTPQVIRENDTVLKMQNTRMTILRAILHYADRNSMSHSVEMRTPFLDYRLVEFCLSLPLSLKIRHGAGKYILRKAMNGILPEQIRNRYDKTGFSSPESVWARGELNDFYREHLSNLKKVPFIKSKVVEKRFEEFSRGEIPYDKAFWRLISLQRWLSIFKISI